MTATTSAIARECWFLTGPTASGKTPIGLALAGRIGAEIVSLDSMALYRGMDIGTAKPTPAERDRVPHHLIDLVAPGRPFSVAQYLEAARRCVDDIRARGRQVLFVGGTPLYLKACLRGIFLGPAADWALRERLKQLEAAHGPGFLHQRLAVFDPVAAVRLHPRDVRRLIRALEVFEATGQPISRWQRQFEVGLTAEECRVFVLDWPRPKLYGRIDGRVEAMFAAGLVEEARRLAADPDGLSRTARQALGYREVLDHLAGRTDLKTAVELVKTHTRQFAKRQLTWFRSLSECRFVAIDETASSDAIAAEIVRRGSGVP
jgi:tRNA dimethylallyltransferase